MTRARNWARRFRPILVLVAISICGCGGRKAPAPAERVVTVSGRITLNGEPLAGGLIMFAPDRQKGNQSALEMFAKADADGNYAVLAGVGEQQRKGAAPGWYRVVVQGFEASASRGGGDAPVFDGPPRLITPKKYADPKATPLLLEVVEDPAPGAYDLVLKGSPG